jgi:hypothetical protein
MNEQMLKIAKQAGLTLSMDQQVAFQRAAELIVKECANAADMAQDAGCEYAGDYVAEYMGFGQEHGVTEWRAK